MKKLTIDNLSKSRKLVRRYENFLENQLLMKICYAYILKCIRIISMNWIYQAWAILTYTLQMYLAVYYYMGLPLANHALVFKFQL